MVRAPRGLKHGSDPARPGFGGRQWARTNAGIPRARPRAGLRAPQTRVSRPWAAASLLPGAPKGKASQAGPARGRGEGAAPLGSRGASRPLRGDGWDGFPEGSSSALCSGRAEPGHHLSRTEVRKDSGLHCMQAGPVAPGASPPAAGSEPSAVHVFTPSSPSAGGLAGRPSCAPGLGYVK